MNVDLQRLTTDQRFAKHHEHENLQVAAAGLETSPAALPDDAEHENLQVAAAGLETSPAALPAARLAAVLRDNLSYSWDHLDQ